MEDAILSKEITAANVKKRKEKSLLREYSEAIIIAMILALVIRSFVVQAFKIPSGSMKETLLVGDHILVSKFSYGIHIPNRIPFTSFDLFPDIHFFQKLPDRGDVIVFKYPKDQTRDFIKRVVGLPGETVEIRDQVVYINGKPLEEGPYVNHRDTQVLSGRFSPRDNMPPLIIPERRLFVMGDNRENSQDSRWWGLLDVDLIKGKAFLIYWSWKSEANTSRWNRIGKLLK